MTNYSGLVDTYKHKGLRRHLAEVVRGKGIRDQRITAAIEKIPRHFFVDSAFAEQAYEDKALSIGAGQTISQPYTVAFQTELLEIKEKDKVLEIGLGSGYQACVLEEIGAIVYSIERIKSLYDKAKDLLHFMGYHPYIFCGDGTTGLPDYAPFDKVIVTAAAPEIPQLLFEQLRIGGIMVVPIGNRDSQIMMKFVKISDKDFVKQEFDYFKFVPLIGKKGWEK